MTRDRSVDERISAWLLEEAPDQVPDRVLQATFERTRPSRQRRAFLGWRFPMYRITPTAIAVGAAAILVIAVGVTQLPRPNQSVGGGPGPWPSASSTPAPTTRPTPSLAPISLTGQIAFERTVDGNTDIYLMNLDRTGLVRLTDDPAQDTRPGWSPDGQRLVFTRGGSGEETDVYVMNADGTGVTALTDTPEVEQGPVFSPDGSEIAFTRYVDPTFFDLYVTGADGSDERRVYHRDGPWLSWPAWSVDGRSLVFNKIEADGDGIDIVRLDLATSEESPIAVDPGDDSSFAFSPDGQTIAFQSDRETGGIFLMDADGNNARHVYGSFTKGVPITWTPDGEHLVFGEADGWLYLVPSSGGEPVKWTEGDGSVAWRPAP